MSTILKYGMWAISVVGLILLVDRSSGSYWVGYTHLDVRLSLKSRDSGKPIPNAIIVVRTFDPNSAPKGLLKDPTDHMYHFSLKTDDSGEARIQFEEVLRSGKRSYFRFTNTYSIDQPVGHWNVYITANGFESITGSLYQSECSEVSKRLDSEHDLSLIEVEMNPLTRP